MCGKHAVIINLFFDCFYFVSEKKWRCNSSVTHPLVIKLSSFSPSSFFSIYQNFPIVEWQPELKKKSTWGAEATWQSTSWPVTLLLHPTTCPATPEVTVSRKETSDHSSCRHGNRLCVCKCWRLVCVCGCASALSAVEKGLLQIVWCKISCTRHDNRECVSEIERYLIIDCADRSFWVCSRKFELNHYCWEKRRRDWKRKMKL